MKATMRRDDWVMVSRGFGLVLGLPEEQERIRQAVIAQGPNNAGPLTIDFPNDFAGGRASFADVLRTIAGPLPITIEE